MSSFTPPNFSPFKVIAGPMQSSYTQIINGRVTHTFSVSYILQAGKEGSFAIPPASAYYGGKKYYSSKTVVNVKKSSGGNQSGSSSLSSSGSAAANETIKKNLFIKLSVDKHSARPGEPVYAVYKLYSGSDLNVLNIAAPKMPVYNGFWATEIEIPQITYSAVETVNGKRYRVAELKKVVLFPTRSGKLTVEPLRMDFTVRVPTRRPGSKTPDPFAPFFDDPMGSTFEDVRFNASSKKEEINVMKLPEPVPANYTNASGQFSIAASIDKQEVKTNEPLTFNLVIKGSGNLSLIEAPALNLPAAFEQFDPKTTDNSAVTPSGIRGNRTFEYVLIPRKSGKYTIPAVPFTYFDFENGKYVSTSTSPITLTVDKGMYAGSTPQAPTKISNDSLAIRESTHLSDIDFTSPFESGGFVIPVGVMLLAAVLLFFRKKRKDESTDPEAKLAKLSGKALAQLRFASAEKALRTGNKNIFFDETGKAMHLYLEKFFRKATQNSNPELPSPLHYEIRDSRLAARVENFLQKCSFACYTPNGGNNVLPEELLREGIELITELETFRHNGRINQ